MGCVSVDGKIEENCYSDQANCSLLCSLNHKGLQAFFFVNLQWVSIAPTFDQDTFLLFNGYVSTYVNHSDNFSRGHCEGGPTARSKKFITPFFKIYWKILSRGYSNGSRTSPFFSFWNISTNMVARGIQSFGQNGPWLAGWLRNAQNFFVKFAQICDEQMLKISGKYLYSYLI